MIWLFKGDGFFQVRKPDGTFVYTRDGSFKINADGTLVTTSGYTLDPDITVNEDTLGISVNRDGTVEAEEAGGGSSSLGNIELVKFINPGGLKHWVITYMQKQPNPEHR